MSNYFDLIYPLSYILSAFDKCNSWQKPFLNKNAMFPMMISFEKMSKTGNEKWTSNKSEAGVPS
jgi:hypothetical protein